MEGIIAQAFRGRQLLRTLKPYEGNYSLIDRQTTRLLVNHTPGKIYLFFVNFGHSQFALLRIRKDKL